MSAVRFPVTDYSDPLCENPATGTHFKPEVPFQTYTRGVVYYNNTTGRRSTTIYTPAADNDGVRIFEKTMLVSRYFGEILYWKLHGCHIPAGMEVDHRDDNFFNDTYENIQFLTREENIKKMSLLRGRLHYVMICPVCLKQYDTVLTYTQLRPATKHSVFHCSHRCRVIFRATLFPYRDFIPLRRWIAERQLHQIVRVWGSSPAVSMSAQEPRREVVKTICEELLSFDLATACGMPVRYDTPQILSHTDQCKLVNVLRTERRPWREIGGIFSLDITSVYEKFKGVSECRSTTPD